MFSIIATTYRGCSSGSRMRESTRSVQISLAVLAVVRLFHAQVVVGRRRAGPRRASRNPGRRRGARIPRRCGRDFRGGEAQHVAQRPVDLHDRPVDLGDGDADDRVGEHRFQPCLAVPPGLLGGDPGRERGRRDLLLLGAGAILQALRVTGGQLRPAPRANRPVPPGRAAAPAMSCGIEHGHGPVQRVDLGEMRVDECRRPPGTGRRGRGRSAVTASSSVPANAVRNGSSAPAAHRDQTGPFHRLFPRPRQLARRSAGRPVASLPGCRSVPAPQTRQAGVVRPPPCGASTSSVSSGRHRGTSTTPGIDQRQITEQCLDLGPGAEPHRVR